MLIFSRPRLGVYHVIHRIPSKVTLLFFSYNKILQPNALIHKPNNIITLCIFKIQYILPSIYILQEPWADWRSASGAAGGHEQGPQLPAPPATTLAVPPDSVFERQLPYIYPTSMYGSLLDEIEYLSPRGTSIPQWSQSPLWEAEVDRMAMKGGNGSIYVQTTPNSDIYP